jgi:hypothetical protein
VRALDRFSRDGERDRASTEAKRKALEAAYQGIVTSDLPEWNQDPGLLDWLARQLSITRRHQGFTCVHPPGLSPHLLIPGWNKDPLGLIPWLRTPAGRTCDARRVGNGQRALTRS